MKKRENKKSPVSVICSALGTAVLVAVIIVCLPLTLPKFMGYELYTVISGSMEPEIPVGSLVFVKETFPEDVSEREVIAFQDRFGGGSITTHRVVENRAETGEFITKGDANEGNDMEPIPYENYIGKVELTVPGVGKLAMFLSGSKGKIVAGACIILALFLHKIK